MCVSIIVKLSGLYICHALTNSSPQVRIKAGCIASNLNTVANIPEFWGVAYLFLGGQTGPLLPVLDIRLRGWSCVTAELEELYCFQYTPRSSELKQTDGWDMYDLRDDFRSAAKPCVGQWRT